MAKSVSKIWKTDSSISIFNTLTSTVYQVNANWKCNIVTIISFSSHDPSSIFYWIKISNHEDPRNDSQKELPLPMSNIPLPLCALLRKFLPFYFFPFPQLYILQKINMFDSKYFFKYQAQNGPTIWKFIIVLPFFFVRNCKECKVNINSPINKLYSAYHIFISLHIIGHIWSASSWLLHS